MKENNLFIRKIYNSLIFYNNIERVLININKNLNTFIISKITFNTISITYIAKKISCIKSYFDKNPIVPNNKKINNK